MADKIQFEFIVKGSSGKEYKVQFSRADVNFTGHCSCQAGKNGMYCKHRFELLDGVIDNLISKNYEDVPKLKGMIAGTDVEMCLKKLKQCETDYGTRSKPASTARQLLAQAMRN